MSEFKKNRNTTYKSETVKEINEDTIDVKGKDEKKDEESIPHSHFCSHTSQCMTRLPTPPPEGPLPLAQFELESIIETNGVKENKIKYYVDQIMEFYRSGADGNLDTSIEELEVIKELLATEDGSY